MLRHIDRALLRDPKKRPTAPQLRDALLHGARAIERGMLEDEPELELAEDRERRLRKSARAKTWIRAALPRRRPRLRVVPDPADGAPSLIQRFVAATSAEVDGDRRAALERAGAAALTGISTAALLGALPFYPVYLPLVLGIGLGLLALRHPLIAAASRAAARHPAGRQPLAGPRARPSPRPCSCGSRSPPGRRAASGCRCSRRSPRSPRCGRCTWSRAPPRRARTSAS